VTPEPAPPVACTLDAGDVPARLARWAELAVHVIDRVELADGVRVTFDDGVRAPDVATLAADEAACCAFLTFSIHLDAGRISLTVTAPTDARAVVDTLLPPAR
jgi:hypothetical protein